MARSRTQAWLRDELILALDLYKREGRIVPASALQELSDLLRSIPIEPELANDPTFRNPNAVQLKVYNFVALDPDATTEGMSRVGQGDRDVWAEFGDDPARLATVAAGIREAIAKLEPAEVALDPDSVSEAPEGSLLTSIHVRRERSAELVAAKKAKALANTDKLACEACGFDFAAVYGSQGDGFIECHHTRPVHTLRPGQRTKLQDLALVCSNCHRMIHRRKQWLTMNEIGAVLDAVRRISRGDD
jgi:5-methylcytosine-specific restriction protein A